MPIYEYRCRDCGRKSTFLTRSVSEAFDPRCKACGSAAVDKLVSRVAVRRSASSRAEAGADDGAVGGFDGEGEGGGFGGDFDRALDEDADGEDDVGEAGGLDDDV